MTTFSGTVIETNQALFSTAGLSSSFTGLGELPLGARGLVDLEALVESVLDENLSNPYTENFSGNRIRSFLDDFYFTIYVIPDLIDFGAVIADSTRTVFIWNANFTSRTLVALQATDVEQVTVSGITVPQTFGALVFDTFQVTVSGDGPPSLSDFLVVEFAEGEAFEVPVLATRSLLWPFFPNWGSPYNDEVTFSTDIITSRSGREQRRAIRQTPRRVVSYNAHIQNAAQLKELRRVLKIWPDKPFIVADAPRSVATTAAMVAGDIIASVDSAPAWLTAGRAVILKYLDQISLREIDGFDSNGDLLFANSDAYDWPTGTRIYAGVRAYLPDVFEFAKDTRTVAHMDVRFAILPGSEIENIDGTEETFDGRPVWRFNPNWRENQVHANESITEFVDVDYGVIERHMPMTYSARHVTSTYLKVPSLEADDMLRFFKRRLGRQGEFYMSSNEDDMVAKFDLIAATVFIRVEGLELYNTYAGDLTRQAIVITLNDGTRLYRKISEITTVDDIDGNDTIVELTEAWATDIDKDDIYRIEWMSIFRFASDTVSTNYLTSEVAEMQLTMRGLEDLEPEDSNSGS